MLNTKNIVILQVFGSDRIANWLRQRHFSLASIFNGMYNSITYIYMYYYVSPLCGGTY